MGVGARFYGGPYPPSSLVKNATEQLVLSLQPTDNL